MYDHFVFHWRRHSRHVTVSHGTLAGPRMALWDDIAIEHEWSPENLATFARTWTREHTGRFRRP
ncbi:hypothetical protein CFN78_12175 [Amycolatopsis antarctica]|uniref:Uncharacterized protein n=2 Tax=Amycolatopsis antarctica TaxID=1854586 RepID=A0A263D6B5_9PSEU|nr:hypothetical protein CFN78_12175 [Amycolatopsis antarctica]